MKRGEINRKRFSEFSGCKKEMDQRGLFGVKCSGHWCLPVLSILLQLREPKGHKTIPDNS